ncbi:MAG: DMT family transporter [Actinobacteria bacterium]|nr:DMT family transporter [Actinomycetota bacterium]
MRAREHLLNPRTRGLLLVGGTAVLWGTSGITATVAYGHGVHPLTVSFWRMASGAAVLLPLLRRRPAGTATPTLASGGRLRLLARLLGVGLGLAAYQAGYFTAVHRAGVSVATLVTLGLAPVLVTVAERVRTRRRTRRTTAVAVVLAVVGLAALVGLPAHAGPGTMSGVAFAAASAAGYAGLTLAGGDLSARLGSPRLTSWTFALSALLLLPLTAAVAGLSLGREPAVLAAMLYLGLVPTALAYRMFFAGLEQVPASAAAVLALLEPIVATGLALGLLGERLTPIGWGGGALLVTAVILVTRRSGAPP